MYESVFSWPCCGPYAREPDWAEPPPSNPNYGNTTPPTAMNWWLTAAGQPVSAPTVFNSTNAIRRWPKRAPSMDELRARVAREGPLMDISRQGFSAESARSSATAASSSEPSAVSARPPTTVPQPKVIYKTPPPSLRHRSQWWSPPFNAAPRSAPPVKAPPVKAPPTGNMPTMALPPTKAPPTKAPQPPGRPPPFERNFQGMFGTHG